MLVLGAAMPLCSVRADIWLCVGDGGRQSIQDKPCTGGLREKSHVVDGGRRASSSRSGAGSAGKPSIDVGLQRNKGVICTLLNTEKAEALAQISGGTPPPPGENPHENLLKIEKQRSRVGCDAG